MHELEREVVRGARGVERDDVAVGHQLRCRGGDRLLGGGRTLQPVGEGALAAAVRRHRAAARAPQQLAPRERVQVLADRHLGHGQLAGELGHLHGASSPESGENPSLTTGHSVSFVR